jgi:hypothetical protein
MKGLHCHGSRLREHVSSSYRRNVNQPLLYDHGRYTLRVYDLCCSDMLETWKTWRYHRISVRYWWNFWAAESWISVERGLWDFHTWWQYLMQFPATTQNETLKRFILSHNMQIRCMRIHHTWDLFRLYHSFRYHGLNLILIYPTM